MPANSLELGLKRALSGRINGRKLADYGFCVPELVPVLSQSVDLLRHASDEGVERPWGGTERTKYLVEQLATKVGNLLHFLKKHQRDFEQLPAHERLCSSDVYKLAGIDTRDMKLFHGSSATLMDVMYLAGYWRAGARRRPGPDAFKFTVVAEFVGFMLREHGIPLTKGKSGYYGRVLAAVYAEAGLRRRDVGRDIRAAFAYVSSRSKIGVGKIR